MASGFIGNEVPLTGVAGSSPVPSACNQAAVSRPFLLASLMVFPTIDDSPAVGGAGASRDSPFRTPSRVGRGANAPIAIGRIG